MTVKKLIEELDKLPKFNDVYMTVHCRDEPDPFWDEDDGEEELETWADSFVITDIIPGDYCTIEIINDEL